VEVARLNKKMILVFVFFLTIVAVTGYCLWQVDQHEKALINQVYLIKPTQQEINVLKQKEQEYWDTLAQFKEKHPEVMRLIYLYGTLRDPAGFSVEERNDKFNLDLPTELQMYYFGRKMLLTGHPSEARLYVEITTEMKKRRNDAFSAALIRGSNPPKPQIEQAIKNYYRIMFAADAIMTLGLVLVVILHKPLVKGQ
jgi:hypothetical protein